MLVDICQLMNVCIVYIRYISEYIFNPIICDKTTVESVKKNNLTNAIHVCMYVCMYVYTNMHARM